MLKSVLIVLLIFSVLFCILYFNRRYGKFNEIERFKVMNGVIDAPYIYYSHHKRVFSLLKQFDTYCRENNIFYFLMGGALIGLERHNSSFIPWDDDIDICILDTDEHFFQDYDRKMFIQVDEDIVEPPGYIIKYTENKKYKSDNEPFLDLFILDSNTFEYKDELPKKAWPNEKYHDIISPLHEREFILYNKQGQIEDKIFIKVPNDIPKYLKRSYGNDFMTSFSYNKPHCNNCYTILTNII